MATVKIILSKKFASDPDGWVKVQVTDNRKQKRYPCTHKKNTADSKRVSDVLELNRKFSDKEFERIMNAQRRTDKEKEYKAAFDSFKRKAESCINQLEVFTFEAFEELYIKNRAAKDAAKVAYDAKIESLKKDGKIGTAIVYRNAIASLEKFKPGLKFANITPDFLRRYDAAMKEAKEVRDKAGKVKKKPGASPTTISIYMRTLRTIFNEAIADGKLSPDLYPFRKNRSDKKGYSPAVVKAKKRALSAEDISKLFFYESKNKGLQQSADFWKFSYLANGMNFTDILQLRWNNVQGDYIRFDRAKTADTSDTKETITVHIKPEMWAIIRKYGVRNIDQDAHIFPILDSNMDAETMYLKKQNFIQYTNKKLKKIGEELGLPNPTSYTARHSFATTLKRNGVSVEIIKETLGHKNLNTTQTYLKSFDEETIKEATGMLIPHKRMNIK